MFPRSARLATLAIAATVAIVAVPRAAAADPPSQAITANTFDDGDFNPASRADLNRDGAINATDLRLFVETRMAGSQGTLVTDINADGEFDHLDLASMLDLIANGAKPAPVAGFQAAQGQSVIAIRGMSRMVGGA